jgi:hypothetical protein
MSGWINEEDAPHDLPAISTLEQDDQQEQVHPEHDRRAVDLLEQRQES